MTYSLALKTTPELTADEVSRYCALFADAFGKARSEGDFQAEFTGTCLGLSYHTLHIHERDGMVGAYTVVPVRYRAFGEARIFGLSVDTMIHACHRSDALHFMRMAEATYEGLVRHGIPFVFGVPNDNSRKYFEKVLGWKRIGELPYYVLPVRPGSLQSWASILDRTFNVSLAAFLSGISHLSSQNPLDALITAEAKGPDLVIPDRQTLELRRGGRATFSIHTEKTGKRIGYLVEICPLSKAAILEAGSRLIREAKNLDFIAYVGPLAFNPFPMIKVPEAMVPKRLFLSGRVLNSDFPAEGLLDLKNWKVSLGSFDVR